LQLHRGDRVLLEINPISSPPAMAIGCGSRLDTDVVGINNYFVTIDNNTAPSGSVTNYCGTAAQTTWNATEANAKVRTGVSQVILSHMIGHSRGTTSAGTLAINARVNEATPASAPTITFPAGSNLEEGDTVHIVTLAPGDYFSLRSVPTGLAGAPVLFFGFGMGDPPPPVELLPFDGGLNGGLAHAYVFNRVLSALEVARRYTARLHGDLSGDFLIQRVRINSFESGEGKNLPIRDVEAGSSRDADLTDLVNPKKKEQ
jgi:hypothetical protein